MIKKLFKTYTHAILAEFKFYRKRKGGTWYQVYDLDYAGGAYGPHVFWTQEKPEDLDTIQKTEVYP